MRLREQAEKYLTDIASDARHNTLATYRSILNARVLPILGEEDLASIDSATAKLLKDRLLQDGLGPASVNLAVGLMERVVKSAVDERGNRLYNPAWNSDFIKLPKIVPRLQKAPIMPQEGLSQAITATQGEIKALVAILGGTGLRIGEALALRQGAGVGNPWDPQMGTVLVRATEVRGKIQPMPKTEAGNRVVDLDPSLNSFMIGMFGEKSGLLFSRSRRAYYKQIAKLNIPGFHSLRRRRLTDLQLTSMPKPLISYAAGHAAEDVTERYAKVGSAIEERKTWAEKAGLGFQL